MKVTTDTMLAWLAWLLLLAACLVTLGRVSISTDMSAFLPRTPSEAQRVLVEQMRSGIATRLLVVALEGADEERLVAISRDLGEKLRASSRFAQVQNGDPRALQRDRDLAWTNRYLLSPAVDAARFEQTGLHEALVRDLDLLSSGAAIATKQLVAADPTGEMLQILPRLLQGTARPATGAGGIWLSRDRNRALLLAETTAQSVDLDGQQDAIGEIEREFLGLRTSHPDAASARVIVSGPGRFAVDARRDMKRDVERLSMIAVAGIITVLLVAYRDPRFVLLSLVPVGSGVLAGFTSVAMKFGTVHGITLGFGVTLIGEAVDYAIYLFTQRERLLWRTLLLGTATSFVGFAAMLLSDFDGLVQLGLFTITGLVVALAVTRWILHPLVGLIRPRETAWPMTWQPPRWTRGAVLVVAIASIAFLATHRPLFDASLQSMSPVSADLEAFDQQMRADLGAPPVRHMLVLHGNDLEAALQKGERADAVLTKAVAQGDLASFEAPTRILPSRETQTARRAALPASQELRQRFAAALQGLPFRADGFEPFFADVERARTGPLLTPSSFDGAGLGLRLHGGLLQRADGATVLMTLQAVRDPAALLRTVQAAGLTDAVLLDLRQESGALLQRYLDEAVLLALLGSIAIVLLLALTLRSLSLVTDAVSPLVAAVLVTAAICCATVGHLTVFHLFGLLLVVAVGSNYVLFLLRDRGDAVEHGRLFRSLLTANLCTVIGFGVLSISAAPVLRGLGGSVALGTGLSLFFALLLQRRAA